MINNPVFSKLELNLPQDQLNRLTILAERMGVSVIDLIKQALRRFLFNEKGGNAVFISAPIIALVDGFYVEDTTMARIKEHGDFGLGTFNYLDGEMVILDGNVYQIRSDGDVYSVKDDEQSPFACVTFFSPDTFDAIEENHTPKEFYNLLNTLIPSENMLYAIRI
jgi:Alpha-acetolactate decarboxylase